MELRTLTPGTPELERLWSGFVAEHPDAGVGHHRAHCVLAEAAGASDHSIMSVDEAGRVMAVLPLFASEERVHRVLRRRVVTSSFEFPAHPLIAHGLSTRQQREVLGHILEAVEAVAADCRAEQVRIAYPVIVGRALAVDRYRYCPLRDFGYVDDNAVALTLDLTRGPDDLLKRMDPSCRNSIRRAEREACAVRAVRDRTEWIALHELSQTTLGPHAPSERTHAAHWDAMISQGLAEAHVLTVGGSDQPSNVVVTAGLTGHWYYWKSYNGPVRTPGANNAVLWAAILSVIARGAHAFELGSLEFTDAKQMAIAAFKRSFGGEPSYLLRGSRSRYPVRTASLGLLSVMVGSVRGNRRS